MYNTNKYNNCTKCNPQWNNNESNHNKDKWCDFLTNGQERDNTSNDIFFDENNKSSDMDEDDKNELNNEDPEKLIRKKKLQHNINQQQNTQTYSNTQTMPNLGNPKGKRLE